MRKSFFSLFLLILIHFISIGSEEFPYRSKYPDAKPISTQKLFEESKNNNAVIIDVRSAMEYNVIHIDGALLIPINDKLNFINEIEAVVKNNKGKVIVFYCNGVTCLKSYEAVVKAQDKIEYSHFYVYDAGIPEWVELYPSQTILLGKVVVDSNKQVLKEEEIEKKFLTYENFLAKSKDENSIVIDARDFIQNTGKLKGLEKALVLPFDKLIPNFIQKKREQNNTLLIFDQVGKQVKWLMYYLVEYGYSDYFFLKGGATEVLMKQEYKN